jgi:hypothetical protein
MAVMKYSNKIKKSSSGYGKIVFYSAFVVLSILGLVYLIVDAPKYREDNCLHDLTCGCPVDPSNIAGRNLIIIDTTDPLRDGKFDDIENLISGLASESSDNLTGWIRGGKKSHMTSVFVLSNQSAAEMRPIAKFCTPPPMISQLFSYNEKNIRQIKMASQKKVSETIKQLQSVPGASQSTIVEAISTLTQAPSYWIPGSKLILVSDMLENSKTCGWFEHMEKIPSLNDVSTLCKAHIRSIQESLRPNGLYTKTSTVAICSLPGRNMKPGLHQFWSEIVKNSVESDILYSCDPQLIDMRMKFLNPEK